jgi:hypothetical protein
MLDGLARPRSQRRSGPANASSTDRSDSITAGDPPQQFVV